MKRRGPRGRGTHPGGRGGNHAHVLDAHGRHAPRSSCERTSLRGAMRDRRPGRSSARERSRDTSCRAHASRSMRFHSSTDARATMGCAIGARWGFGATSSGPSLDPIGPRGTLYQERRARLDAHALRRKARCDGRTRTRDVLRDRAVRGPRARSWCHVRRSVAEVVRPSSGPTKRDRDVDRVESSIDPTRARARGPSRERNHVAQAS